MVAAGAGGGKRWPADWYTAWQFTADGGSVLRLCAFDELEENTGRGFSVRLADADSPIFVVRRDGRVYGYRNVCPHRGTSLDWLPDQFLDAEREYIQCATHDARFRVEDGYCVAGPCSGKSLAAVPVAVVDGEIVIER